MNSSDNSSPEFSRQKKLFALAANPPPNVVETTQAHLGMLVSTIERIGQLVRVYNCDAEEGHSSPTPALSLSLETTLIKASNVIDDILDDRERWSTAGAKRTHAMVQEALAAHTANLKAQTNESIRRQMPSAMLRPTIFRRLNVWYARYGTGAGAVVGKGSTPREAMADFDYLYLTGNKPNQCTGNNPNQ